jgi:hypothetical protein
MSDESLEHVERQIASIRGAGSPLELRGAVLGGVQRELRASRWDRRLARAAAVLLVVGVGMNAALALRFDGAGERRLVGSRRSEPRPTVVDTAVVVAEATDLLTARRFARQLAAMAGRTLTKDESAAIDAAVHRPAARVIPEDRG